jgi:Rap1a immunity proteins
LSREDKGFSGLDYSSEYGRARSFLTLYSDSGATAGLNGPTVQDLIVGQECASYVMGALDTFEFIRSTDGQKYAVQALCIPREVNSSEALRVFLKYSDNHPEELHLSVPLVIWDAMHQAFPCHVSK